MPNTKKTYAGANGSKLSIIYDNEIYMLKFPAPPAKNKEMSYSNSCISEYLGCKIFKSIGIQTQDVLLGMYTTKKRQNKIVVACKDFTSTGIILQDFASLKNQIIDSERNGYGTELNDVLSTFQQQNSIDPATLSSRFWDMFIVDALIGNWDRHNGNWGFLYNSMQDTVTLAPVFDCGSSLFPQADNDMIQDIMNNQNEINHRIYNYPMSALCINGKKINYYDFISSLKNQDCNLALKRILPRIDMDKINKLIDEIPVISSLQKDFYKLIISERKEHILDNSLKLLHRQELLNDHIL